MRLSVDTFEDQFISKVTFDESNQQHIFLSQCCERLVSLSHFQIGCHDMKEKGSELVALVASQVGSYLSSLVKKAMAAAAVIGEQLFPRVGISLFLLEHRGEGGDFLLCGCQIDRAGGGGTRDRSTGGVLEQDAVAWLEPLRSAATEHPPFHRPRHPATQGSMPIGLRVSFQRPSALALPSWAMLQLGDERFGDLRIG